MGIRIASHSPIPWDRESTRNDSVDDVNGDNEERRVLASNNDGNNGCSDIIAMVIKIINSTSDDGVDYGSGNYDGDHDNVR